MRHENHNRENQALVLALLRSQQLFFRAMGPVFRTADLTTSQWDALETLSNKGALSINDLMRLMLSTSGNIDVVVKNLMQAGFVEKTVDETDRRARVLRLTRAGKEKVEDFLLIHNEALDQMLTCMRPHIAAFIHCGPVWSSQIRSNSEPRALRHFVAIWFS